MARFGWRNQDFVIRFDPKTEDKKVFGTRVIESMFINRNKAKKPNIIFIGADSGEGKSIAALAFYCEFMKAKGLDPLEFIDDCNVYSPLEYPKKLEAMLDVKGEINKDNKRLKKVNILIIHEAREAIRAKNWQEFANQAISDVNAMSRSIKPMTIVIISQFIRDIDSKIRYTLTHYARISRPRGKKSKMYLQLVWKDDRDIMKPLLRLRRIYGTYIEPSGRRVAFSPSFFTITMPDQEIINKFEKSDKDAKHRLIHGKMQRLIENLEKEYGDKEFTKIEAMVKYYSEHQDQIPSIGKVIKKRWRLNKSAKEMHDLTNMEAKVFEERFEKKIKEIQAI